MIDIPLKAAAFKRFVEQHAAELASPTGLRLAPRTYMRCEGGCYIVYSAAKGAADGIPLVGFFTDEQNHLLIKLFPLSFEQAVPRLKKLNALLPINVQKKRGRVLFHSHFPDGSPALFAIGMDGKIGTLYFLPDGTYVNDNTAETFQRGEDLEDLLREYSLESVANRGAYSDNGGGWAEAFELDYVEQRLGFVDPGVCWAVLESDSAGFTDVFEFSCQRVFEKFWAECVKFWESGNEEE